MKSVLNLVVVAVLFPTLAGAQDKEISAKDVLARFVKESGGKEGYAKLKSYKVTGRISVGAAGPGFPLLMMGTLKPLRQLQSLDQGAAGKTQRFFTEVAAWESAPGGTRFIDGVEYAQARREASFLPELTPDKFYKSLKLVGKESVQGDECYKVQLTPKVGKPEVAFYSIKSGLKRKAIQTVKSKDDDVRIETISSEYRKVGGLLKVAFTTTQKLTPGKTPNQTVNIMVRLEKFELNLPVDKKLFEAPADIRKKAAAKKARAKAAAKKKDEASKKDEVSESAKAGK